MAGPPLKAIIWLGDSKEVIRGWPERTRRRAGEELYRLQLGSEPRHWRSMKTVGAGVREIRISEGGQHRILYLLRRGEEILVLHAFEKKTQRTARSDIALGKRRLKAAESGNTHDERD